MHRKQKGSALLSALFIMVLVAIAASAMSIRLQIDIHRTRISLTSDRVYLASQAVTFWAMDILSHKTQFVSQDAHGKLLNFPRSLQTMYPHFKIEGELYDLQARFNLNNLQDASFQSMFLALLEELLVNDKTLQLKKIVQATVYWISPYHPGDGHSEELDYYMHQDPSYIPSYQTMVNSSEWRLVRGVNEHVYQTLLPYITVLPEPTPINLNTAPPSLLKTLGHGLNESQLSELLEAKGEHGIKDLKDITVLTQKLDIPYKQITLTSQYFLCVAMVHAPDLTLTKYTLLKKNPNKTEAVKVTILQESLNTP